MLLTRCALAIVLGQAFAACANSSDPLDSSVDSANSPSDSADTSSQCSPQTGSWTFETDIVHVASTVAPNGLCSYTLQSTHSMRDDSPSERTFSEMDGEPILRSGVLLTDALFALALEEARQNAVSQISDAAFSKPQACECYQTGELWNWVWTRDIAYATELGLAWVDPERAANSLMFKLSELKDGGQLQIVQDTGTGGSYPVSTDRVTWARGAMAVLNIIDHPELEAAAIEAMRNTAELDRVYAQDPIDGLYRGETSFLDWREQTYPDWVADNVVHIGMSKSLSTNLNHLFLLRSLEELTGEDHQSARLEQAIETHFWDGERYRSRMGTTLDSSLSAQEDLLATSLAVLDLGTHPESLSLYPFGPYGPPVIWPQQQFVPIYHNRAIWPFVTAYSVLASRKADNAASLQAGLDSLVRGAALNLSHMENFELVTGSNWLDDGDYSGPIVNSRRQLWSVAGFLGAVGHGVFGLEGNKGTLTGDPILPPGEWFEEGATLTVRGLTLEVANQELSPGSITAVKEDSWTDVFGARAPGVFLSNSGNTIELSLSTEEGAQTDLYRDGQLILSDAGGSFSETRNSPTCYTAVARLTFAGPPSEPICWWGEDYRHIQTIDASAFSVEGGAWSTNHGRGHYENWGAPSDSLRFTVTPHSTGKHLIQAVYGNGSNGTDTGITSAVKQVWVVDEVGTVVSQGVLLMPQRGDWANWGDSSFVPASLTAGQAYTVIIEDGFNMSHLAHYTDYTGGPGGGEGPYNYVNISEFKLLFRE